MKLAAAGKMSQYGSCPDPTFCKGTSMSVNTGPNWYILLVGLPRPSAIVNVAPGLTLLPLSHRLRAFDAFGAVACGFREAGALADMMYGATCEFESAADNSTTPGFDTLNRAWLASTLLSLRGHWGAFCPAAISTSWCDLSQAPRDTWDEPAAVHEIKIRTDLSLRGVLLDLHYKMLSIPIQETPPTEAEVFQWTRQYFGAANRLCAESAQFHFGLMAASDWRFSPDLRSAVARLWAGIEALLGINVELAYRASLVCAALLEEFGPARLALFKQVKLLYGKRSKAVHGDKISDSDLLDAASQSLNLLTRLLVRCLERDGVPTTSDQEVALLGSDR